ncbi:hypothetical protein ACFPN2_37455 [Steroidobacter flavus]|uniref:Uncharacterized protein n=1 Tax=Steroidobacter flavus TaxID=1842136 RepID=A0ABV8T4V7_9GAMM
MTFAELLPRLQGRLHWRLFICNLKLAMNRGLLKPADIQKIFQLQPDPTILESDSHSLLGNLQRQIHDPRLQLLLRHPLPDLPAEFQDGITTVINADDREYYVHPNDFSGHDFDLPGRAVRRFKSTAQTREFFWVAPRALFELAIQEFHAQQDPTTDVKRTDTAKEEGGPMDDRRLAIADRIRDLLGLVHHGRKVQLMAISLRVPAAQRTCLPTVIEALPNLRFLQSHSKPPPGTGCGYTVDLQKLETQALGEAIAGAPELVMERVLLRDCDEVEVVTLGVTRKDRATLRASRRFLDQMEYILRLKFSEVLDEFLALVQPSGSRT